MKPWKGSRILFVAGAFLLLVSAGALAADTNVAPLGTATQSSMCYGDFNASLALNGNYSDFTHTCSTDVASWWQVDLGTPFAMGSIVIWNRVGCCESRLRDITVTITNADGSTTYFTSPLLNPENILGGGVFDEGPALIPVDLVALTGGTVTGQVVRLTRTPDPDSSGTGGEGGTDEQIVLSLAEVEIFVNTDDLPPTITAQPQGGTHYVGEFLALSVGAIGGDPKFYQWSKDGSEIPGATMSKLFFDSLQTTDAGTYTVVVTNAKGSDTSDPAVLVVPGINLAPSGVATQSTTCYDSYAQYAIDGNLGNFSHTCEADPAPYWQLQLPAERDIASVVLYNRTSCCGSRLRDITVKVLNEDGTEVRYTSALLNPENTGFAYPDGPASITADIVADTGGGMVKGSIVRVERTPDPDLSGTAGQGNTGEPASLSLGEVVVVGEGPLPRPDTNYARHGTAAQSSDIGYPASLAINGNLGDFTHTANTDLAPWWELTLPADTVMHMIAIHNRTSCCGSRLRDITVTILDGAKKGVVYTSALLNPENVLGVFPNGPALLTIDLVLETGGPVTGKVVRITRTIDDDLTGSGGQGNVDEGRVLSLGEVVIAGACPDERGAHCAGLTVEGPGGNAPGYYTLTASGVDDSNHLLSYTIAADNGFDPKSAGPQGGNQATFRLGVGTWNITARVDDSLRCPDDAANAVCTDTLVIAGDPANIALKGTASQSSTGFGGIPYRAIDGIVDGVYGNGSMSHTADADEAPWWEVDLGSSNRVDSIVLWNRTDCCGDRLSNFRVSVLDGARAEVFGQDCFIDLTFPDTSVDGFTVTPPANTVGQIVRIAILGPNAGGTKYVSLAEAQVFGEPTVVKPGFKRGDTNSDGSVNIADPIYLLGYLFAQGPAAKCPDTADANDDGSVNIADAIKILGKLFGGEPDLPPPYGACGPDPSDDTLGACDYPEDKC